ncbi:MAG: alpha/beta hydrolase [Mariprofundaceae bacterium]
MHQPCLASEEIETRPNPDFSVIWLHGLGADGHDFEPIVPELNLPDDLALRFIFPHAPSIPVGINNGYIMPAWYDIQQNDLGIKQDEAGIRQSAKSIELLIERERMRGIASRRIILAGFSQGGAMALHTGLRASERLGGIIVLSAYLILPETLKKEAHPSNRQTPIFMAHGVNDPIVPLRLGDAGHQQLLNHSYTVTWHSYPMKHSVCAEEIKVIGSWITKVLHDV